jgi:hypothetical protein
MSQIANKEAEIESLRSANELLQQERSSAKSIAEREALSTGNNLTLIVLNDHSITLTHYSM